MTPKEQKIQFWYRDIDGSIEEYCEKYFSDGWVTHSISMKSSNAAYIILYKY